MSVREGFCFLLPTDDAERKWITAKQKSSTQHLASGRAISALRPEAACPAASYCGNINLPSGKYNAGADESV